MNISITPTISVVAAGISTTLVAGSRTATSAAGFGSVVAGQKVFGPGIPYGTKVSSVESTSSLTLDNFAKLTGAKTLQYGYFAAAAYQAGDVLGWYFPIPLSRINNVMVVDKVKQITAVKLYIYDGEPKDTPQLDNAAFAPSDADAAKIIAYHSFTGSVVLGNNQIVFPANTPAIEILPLPITGADMWGQLVCVGTPTFGAINDLVVNIGGE